MRQIYKEQRLQEEEYSFPYHHIIYNNDLKNNFSPVKCYPFGHIYLNYVLKVCELIENKKFTTLLDVGCGDGFFLRFLNDLIPGKEYFGIDYSSKAIAFARAFDPKVSFLHGDVTQNIFDNKQFDIVTSIAVFEHIPIEDLNSFLDAHYRIISKDGILILAVPSDVYNVTDKHFQHFNETKIRKLVDGKFKVEKIFYTNNRKMFITRFISKILKNRSFLINNNYLLNKLFQIYLKLDKKANKDNAFIQIYQLLKL